MRAYTDYTPNELSPVYRQASLSTGDLVIGPIRTVMVFVPDPERAARWWAGFIDTEVNIEVNDDSQVYAWFEVAGVEYGWHPAEDERNPRGGSPVIYWNVGDLAAARERLVAAGCTAHRDPLRVDADRKICQLVDPFGTIFGIDGP